MPGPVNDDFTFSDTAITNNASGGIYKNISRDNLPKCKELENKIKNLPPTVVGANALKNRWREFIIYINSDVCYVANIPQLLNSIGNDYKNITRESDSGYETVFITQEVPAAAAQEAQYAIRRQLESSNRELHQNLVISEQQKILLQNNLDAYNGNINQILDDYNNLMRDLTSYAAFLERQNEAIGDAFRRQYQRHTEEIRILQLEFQEVINQIIETMNDNGDGNNNDGDDESDDERDGKSDDENVFEVLIEEDNGVQNELNQQLEATQQQLKATQQQLEATQQQLADAQRQGQPNNLEEIKTLQQQLADAQRQLADAQRQLADAQRQGQSNNSEEEIKKMQNRLNDLKQTILDRNAEIKSLSDAAISAQNEQNTDASSRLMDHITTLQTMIIPQLIKEKEELEAKLKNTQSISVTVQLQEKVRELTEKLQAAKNANGQTENREILELNEKIKRLQQELKERENKRVVEPNEDAKQLIAKLQRDLDKQNAKVQQLQQHLEYKTVEVKHRQTQINAQLNEKKDLRDYIQKLEGKKSEYENKIQQLNDSLERASGENDELVESLRMLIDAERKMQKKYNSLLENANRAQRPEGRPRSNSVPATQERKIKNENVALIQRTIEKFKQKKKNSDQTEVKKLKERNNTLLQHREILANTAEALIENLQRSRRTIAELKEKLNSVEGKADEIARASLELSRDELINSFITQLQNLEKKINESPADITKNEAIKTVTEAIGNSSLGLSFQVMGASGGDDQVIQLIREIILKEPIAGKINALQYIFRIESECNNFFSFITHNAAGGDIKSFKSNFDEAIKILENLSEDQKNEHDNKSNTIQKIKGAFNHVFEMVNHLSEYVQWNHQNQLNELHKKQIKQFIKVISYISHSETMLRLLNDTNINLDDTYQNILISNYKKAFKYVSNTDNFSKDNYENHENIKIINYDEINGMIMRNEKWRLTIIDHINGLNKGTDEDKNKAKKIIEKLNSYNNIPEALVVYKREDEQKNTNGVPQEDATELQKLRRENAMYAANNKLFQQERNEANQKLQDLKKELEEKNNKIQELNNKIGDAKDNVSLDSSNQAEINRLQGELNAVKEEEKKLNSVIQQLNNKIQEQENEIVTEEKEIEKLIVQKERVESELKELTEKYSPSTNEDDQKKMQNLEEENKRLSEQLKVLYQAIKEEQKRQQAADQRISKSTKLDELDKQIKNRELGIKRLNATLKKKMIVKEKFEKFIKNLEDAIKIYGPKKNTTIDVDHTTIILPYLKDAIGMLKDVTETYTRSTNLPIQEGITTDLKEAQHMLDNIEGKSTNYKISQLNMTISKLHANINTITNFLCGETFDFKKISDIYLKIMDANESDRIGYQETMDKINTLHTEFLELQKLISADNERETKEAESKTVESKKEAEEIQQEYDKFKSDIKNVLQKFLEKKYNTKQEFINEMLYFLKGLAHKVGYKVEDKKINEIKLLPLLTNEGYDQVMSEIDKKVDESIDTPNTKTLAESKSLAAELSDVEDAIEPHVQSDAKTVILVVEDVSLDRDQQYDAEVKNAARGILGGGNMSSLLTKYNCALHTSENQGDEIKYTINEDSINKLLTELNNNIFAIQNDDIKIPEDDTGRIKLILLLHYMAYMRFEKREKETVTNLRGEENEASIYWEYDILDEKNFAGHVNKIFATLSGEAKLDCNRILLYYFGTYPFLNGASEYSLTSGLVKKRANQVFDTYSKVGDCVYLPLFRLLDLGKRKDNSDKYVLDNVSEFKIITDLIDVAAANIPSGSILNKENIKNLYALDAKNQAATTTSTTTTSSATDQKKSKNDKKKKKKNIKGGYHHQQQRQQQKWTSQKMGGAVGGNLEGPIIGTTIVIGSALSTSFLIIILLFTLIYLIYKLLKHKKNNEQRLNYVYNRVHGPMSNYLK